MLDDVVGNIIKDEEIRQESTVELIASENVVSDDVRAALGSVFSNKYSEGYPGKRYYGGQTHTDRIERLAIQRARDLFGYEWHVNVQPHSGSQANAAAYLALFGTRRAKILGMNLAHGGHLTHGHPLTSTGQLYEFIPYGTKDNDIDYDEMERLALTHRPDLLLVGFSSFTRLIDYERVANIAKKIGAITMFDMAHVAGLVAGKAWPDPTPYFDIITFTTHKTLRGPRGGVILCKPQFAKAVDRAVFPGIQGGPHMHVIAAKAVCFHEALQPEFAEYIDQVLVNAKVMEEEFVRQGAALVFGGTDNHMLLIDTMTSYGISGGEAQQRLEAVGISVNKNVIPGDQRSPNDPSGIRIGTPSMTTRGWKRFDSIVCANKIDMVLSSK